MWHKLREIFGYKDSRNSRAEGTENTVVNSNENATLQVLNEQTQTSRESVNLSTENQVKDSSNEPVPQSDIVSSPGLWTRYKNKWNDDCFECRVTVSVVTFCLMAHVCRSLWNRRPLVRPSQRVSIVIANLSLFGMWLSYMKMEWYDEKVDKNEQKNHGTVLDRFKF